MRGNLIKRILFILLFFAAAFALVMFAFRDALPELLPLLKSGDVDPRGVVQNCETVSDKARAIGGGVLEAILYLKRRNGNVS